MQSKPLTTMAIWASVSKRRSCWPRLHRSARRPSKSTFLHRLSISRKYPSSECKKSARPRKLWEFQRSNNWGAKWGIIGAEKKYKILNNKDLHIIPGGESGIRTRVRVSPKHAFQACAFSHSAISPRSIAPIVMKSGGGVQRDAYSEFGTVALPIMGMLFLRQNT